MFKECGNAKQKELQISYIIFLVNNEIIIIYACIINTLHISNNIIRLFRYSLGWVTFKFL